MFFSASFAQEAASLFEIPFLSHMAFAAVLSNTHNMPLKALCEDEGYLMLSPVSLLPLLFVASRAGCLEANLPPVPAPTRASYFAKGK